MDGPSVLLVRGLGLLAREWVGDLRLRDVTLVVEDEEGNAVRRVALPDPIVQALVSGACRGDFAELAGDVVRGFYDRAGEQSFALESRPEDDLAVAVEHLERVPGLEATAAAMRRELEVRRAADPAAGKVRRLPLGGSLGAKAIHDLLIAPVIERGENGP